ncbi:hypothetical protein SETIT_3G366300v2 [Setaria italica]|uniref:Uncharacterized protein n=1 Tax=Setaria italica TaxID=4555 RepID=A0A368QMT1_SETIT|nr:hypothetical protein SETIT_3G366300v2 [Setaria italica]
MAMGAVGDRREASSTGEALPPLAASRTGCAWYRSLPADLRISVLADLHGLKVKPQLADDAALPFLLQNEQPDGATSCSGGHSSF